MSRILSAGRWVTDNVWALSAQPASGANLTANKALYLPFTVPWTIRVSNMEILNGTVVSGNIDLGIYDLAGNRLASNGGTAQSGISSVQSVAMSATVTLPPGTYYMAFVMDNTTGRIFRSAGWQEARIIGGKEQTSAYPLPDPMSLATDYAPASQTVVMAVVPVGTP